MAELTNAVRRHDLTSRRKAGMANAGRGCCNSSTDPCSGPPSARLRESREVKGTCFRPPARAVGDVAHGTFSAVRVGFPEPESERTIRSDTRLGVDVRCGEHDGRVEGWLAVLLKIVYLLTSRVLGLVFRGDRAKDADCSCFGTRTRRCAGAPAGRGMSRPTDVVRRISTAHHYTALPHLGIAKRVPDGEHDGNRITVIDLDRELIDRKPFLGALINEYARAAWHPGEPQITKRILTGNRAVSSGRVQPPYGAMLPGAVGELR